MPSWRPRRDKWIWWWGHALEPPVFMEKPALSSFTKPWCAGIDIAMISQWASLVIWGQESLPSHKENIRALRHIQHKHSNPENDLNFSVDPACLLASLCRVPTRMFQIKPHPRPLLSCSLPDVDGRWARPVPWTHTTVSSQLFLWFCPSPLPYSCLSDPSHLPTS